MASSSSTSNNTKLDPSNTLILSGFDRSDFPARSSSPSNEEAEGVTEDIGSTATATARSSSAPPSTEAPCLTSEIQRLISETNGIPIVHWGNLKSFGRVIIVFQNVQDAAQARSIIQSSSTSPDKPIKAYFDKHTPLYEVDSEDSHLKLPDQGRLFFISPPPSPPAGWVSHPESSPNTETFHSDLHEALSNLGNGSSLENDIANRFSGNDDSSAVSSSFNPQTNSNDISPFPSETVVSPATGKLMRRVTLHKSQKSSSLSLKTDDATLGAVGSPSGRAEEGSTSPSVATPTIVVEWDEDGENDSQHMPGNWGRSAEQPKLAEENTPEKMRSTRTERPPMADNE